MTEETKNIPEELPQKELSALDFDTGTDFIGDYIQEQIENNNLFPSQARTETAESTKADIPFVPHVQANKPTEKTPSTADNQQNYPEFKSVKQSGTSREQWQENKRREAKQQKQSFKPLSENNSPRVFHYGVFGVFYIFHLLFKLDFSFVYFPTLFIVFGLVGIKIISQFFLSRQALLWSETASVLGHIIFDYIILYGVIATIFGQAYSYAVYFYTPNILENLLLLVVASAVGLKFSANYEWRAVTWIAPVIGIWLFLVSTVGVHLFLLR